MICFVRSAEMKITLAPEQKEMLSSMETIRMIIKDNPDTVMAFDIFKKDDLIVFILVNRSDDHKYFLIGNINKHNTPERVRSL